MTRIGSTHIPVIDENGRTRLVPKSRKARLAALPANKRAAATYNETQRVKPVSRRAALSTQKLERSDREIDGR